MDAENKKGKTVITTQKKDKGNDKKRLLAVLEILKRTDEEHPLTKNEIINKVVELGIEVNNSKTIAADLNMLRECGYDIVTDYGGSFMAGGQTFENYELKILADNIANARYLTAEHSCDLIERIKALATESGEQMIAATTVMDKRNKSRDGKNKYKLDVLFRCIQKKRKIKFKYCKPAGKGWQTYIASPYALTLYEDNYYLTAAFDAGKSYSDTPFNFKVSRMDRVEETEEKVRPVSDFTILTDGGGFADIETYRHIMKNMWGGTNAREVVLKCSPALADSNLVLSAERSKENEDGTLTVHTRMIINEGCYQTLARYGDAVEILRPEEARAGLVEYLDRIVKLYR